MVGLTIDNAGAMRRPLGIFYFAKVPTDNAGQ